MTARPDVSVVIPTYQRSGRLRELINALTAQTMEPSRFEVVLVDDCSQDDTWDVLQKVAATAPFTVQTLRTSHNGGQGPARNLGWRSAQAMVVAFLDDDCLPEPDWLAQGLDAVQSDAALGVVQGRVCVPSDFDPTVMGLWYHTIMIDGPTPYFESANIFYRRQALEDGGGFDERFARWGEDTSLGWKVLEAGWRRGFAVKAVVAHEVQPRGWRWYVRAGLLERHNMKLAKEHPGFRREAFWLDWAYRPEDLAFVLAVIGLGAAVRVRPAALLTLPYLWRRRPRQGLQGTPSFFAQNVAVDAARSAGQLWGALAHKVWVI